MQVVDTDESESALKAFKTCKERLEEWNGSTMTEKHAIRILKDVLPKQRQGKLTFRKWHLGELLKIRWDLPTRGEVSDEKVLLKQKHLWIKCR